MNATTSGERWAKHTENVQASSYDSLNSMIVVYDEHSLAKSKAALQEHITNLIEHIKEKNS
jgi:hypothetical protein